MVQSVSELAAMCVGVIGLIGAAATTGLPMWKVTAFIGENIIVMETRWEGLWMNCYRQANIRMQCKVYDSLLYLPSELQAARGLMCCSVALSSLGLLVALLGMRCISCLQSNRWAKNIILLVAGGMQFMASLCVFIPVSWTGHVIIRDFYNPLLIDAQRRELGEALYIGWVTGACLFASSLLFLCRRVPMKKDSFDIYHPVNLMKHEPPPASINPSSMIYEPISSVPSLEPTYQHFVSNNGSIGQQFAVPLQNAPQVMASRGSLVNPSVIYTPARPESLPVFYQGSVAQPSPMHSLNHNGGMFTPANSLVTSQNANLYSSIYTSNAPSSFQSSFYPRSQTPVFITYKKSMVLPESYNGSSAGLYI
ncbi:claudin-8-like [Oryzias latipes]|uniref:claudin-8-like n=1 Tax=Oryzias latipes TaxID=8090 RepID=UPI0000E9E40D|nr:claudin-8-like [Oryzias latipes]